MTGLPQQPSSEAVEILAELMLRRAIRQSPELVARQIDNTSSSTPVKVPEQLSLTLVVRVD
jgi:hypothetical protein